MVISLEQAQDFITSILPKVRTNFEGNGFLHPVAFIGAQINPETSEPFVETTIIAITPEMLGVSMSNNQGVQMYTMGLRQISKMCKAIMVVSVIEAWRLMFPKGEDPRAGRKNFPRSLEHAPGREECIQVMMEHHKLNGKVMMWCATITRDKQERGILAEFTGPDTIDGSGRFLGMVETLS
ncbi:hypothetical protein M0R72_01220 [Candidatus Pacearchaeota archaeon]|jgi:hypothetical protein|nr:hypothetical protein [Candidatus Pacearchaeota archaeon]